MSNVLTLTEKKTPLEQLYQIQTQAPPTSVRLFNAKKVYKIDLNSREVEAPRLLSVEKDHKSTVVYFKLDRYYDYMDLANTICLIQYLPPSSKVPYTYVVPFFDVLTYKEDGKMVIAWDVGGPATQKEGVLQFAIRFYKIQEREDGKAELVYNLNTIPATTRISYGLEADDEAMKAEYDEPIQEASQFENLINALSNQRTEWTILT